MKFAFNVKSHYTLGKSIIQIPQLVEALKKQGFDGAVLCDDNLAGVVEFYQEMTKAKLKPIIGLEKDNSIFIAKNKEGWFELIKLQNNIIDHSNCKNLNQVVGYSEPICYINKEDAIDHKVCLCIHHDCTFENIDQCIQGEDRKFLDSDEFFLREGGELLAKEVEDYSILEKPRLPRFDPSVDSNERLTKLCRAGWIKKIKPKNLTPEQEAVYVQRIKFELDVLQKAKMSDYFLIVADLYDFILKKWMQGPGRGSVGGCLTAYLCGITQTDPIKYKLMFERFWNPARATKLPDIDCDVPTANREDIIEYIKSKYGADKVYQMATYNTMKGRGAIQDVLRVRGGVTPQERNEITKHIPDEAKIMGFLQEMKEAGETPSIVLWALKNKVEKLKQWAYINEEGQVMGPLAKRFEQAIRLEGTIKNISKHAAGITLSDLPLKEICPLIKDPRSDGNLTGVDMYALEELGVIKLDILGLSILDKIMECQKLIEEKHANTI